MNSKTNWKGSWDGDTYTGSYTFEDGTVFTGTVIRGVKQVIVHLAEGGFTKTVDQPVESRMEFTGTWEKDGAAGSPMVPPPPE